MGSVSEELFSSLRLSISRERLAPYRRSEDEDEIDAFARYYWNTALSEALYPVLQCLEISLRNSIHRAAVQAFDKDSWFDPEVKILQDRESKKVAEAKENSKRGNKPIEPGRIVAELNFGFWTSLLNSRYEQVLWPKITRTTFPHVPRRFRNRKALLKRLNSIRYLRNRVFHYEPIRHWEDLAQQHTDVLETIAWINPALSRTMGILDRFLDVYEQSYEPYRQSLAKLKDRTEQDI